MDSGDNDKAKTLSQSDEFEEEMDEFFKERAEFRTASIADGSQKVIAEEREGNTVNMSGCCMTGCHDCPWNYSPNQS